MNIIKTLIGADVQQKVMLSYAHSEDSDQPVHLHSLIRVFTGPSKDPTLLQAQKN